LSVLQNYIQLPALDAVILSHYHADHASDIGCLQYACLIDMDLGRRHTPLPVYGHTESKAFNTLSYRSNTKGLAYDAATKLCIGPFTFTFCPTVHPDPCFAIKADAGSAVLVYSGDTGVNDLLTDFSRKADLLICEASLYDELQGSIPGHMTSGEAGRMAREAGVGTLLATHLPHFGNHADLLAQASQAFGGETVLAARGLSMEI
jgi:ribonuclease BN (tRNA processing enzyme)